MSFNHSLVGKAPGGKTLTMVDILYGIANNTVQADQKLSGMSRLVLPHPRQ